MDKPKFVIHVNQNVIPVENGFVEGLKSWEATYTYDGIYEEAIQMMHDVESIPCVLDIDG